ncbi:hypothetical protein Tco_1313558 [Tanacetum coccineum]
MEAVSSPMVATAKLPVLNPGEFKLWKIRIEQYFLMTDYALWEVIVNGDCRILKNLLDRVFASALAVLKPKRLKVDKAWSE